MTNDLTAYYYGTRNFASAAVLSLQAALFNVGRLSVAGLTRINALVVSIFSSRVYTAIIVLSAFVILPIAVYGIYIAIHTLFRRQETVQNNSGEPSTVSNSIVVKKETKELGISYEIQAQVFLDNSRTLKEKKDSLSSIEYGQMLKGAESALNTIKETLNENPLCGYGQKVGEMEKEFEEFINRYLRAIVFF